MKELQRAIKDLNKIKGQILELNNNHDYYYLDNIEVIERNLKIIYKRYFGLNPIYLLDTADRKELWKVYKYLVDKADDLSPKFCN